MNSISARQQLFERELGEICRAKARPRVLSIGNGLVYEAESVLSYGCFQAEDFVIFDTDADVLDFLRCKYRRCAPRLIQGSVGMLAEHAQYLGKFDFVYSATLLENLNRSDARHAAALLTSLLNPGGYLMLANLALMRTEDEMAGLLANVPEHQMGGHIVYRDDSGNTVFLEVHRAAHCRQAKAPVPPH